jgi:heat shock protein HslJ
VGGNTGCNAFGGNAEVNEDDGTVTFSEVFSTMRACTGERGESDSAMMAVLQGTVTVELDGETLTLTNANGDSLQLTATEEPPADEEQGDDAEPDDDATEDDE